MSDTQENSPFESRHENNQFCSVYLLSVHAQNVCFFTFFRENWGIHGYAFFAAVKRILYVSRHCLWVLGRCGGSNV